MEKKKKGEERKCEYKKKWISYFFTNHSKPCVDIYILKMDKNKIFSC